MIDWLSRLVPGYSAREGKGVSDAAHQKGSERAENKETAIPDARPDQATAKDGRGQAYLPGTSERQALAETECARAQGIGCAAFPLYRACDNRVSRNLSSGNIQERQEGNQGASSLLGPSATFAAPTQGFRLKWQGV